MHWFQGQVFKNPKKYLYQCCQTQRSRSGRFWKPIKVLNYDRVWTWMRLKSMHPGLLVKIPRCPSGLPMWGGWTMTWFDLADQIIVNDLEFKANCPNGCPCDGYDCGFEISGPIEIGESQKVEDISITGSNHGSSLFILGAFFDTFLEPWSRLWNEFWFLVRFQTDFDSGRVRTCPPSGQNWSVFLWG